MIQLNKNYTLPERLAEFIPIKIASIGGAGGDPEVGYQAALESADEIREALADTDVIFICAGLGGGTGSGAAPYVAHAAREAGALVIAFVTLPFAFEGKRRN